MGKSLSEMSLYELWQLFPIVLTEHKDIWADYYFEMENTLNSYLSEYRVKQISHIGSTAIKGIWAKPIVDILLEIEPDENMDAISKKITDIGFIKMSESENRMSFNYGYTEHGFAEKVYHLHLRFAGDHDEIFFRDYLNRRDDLAQAYEKRKLELWHKFEHDRDGYTNAKTDWVRKITEEAKCFGKE